MNEGQHEMFLDLLTKKAVYGIDGDEQAQLDKFDSESADMELQSFEITAAAISMIGISDDERMPDHLQAKILSGAHSYFDEKEPVQSPLRENVVESDDGGFTLKPEKPQRSLFGWLGWAVAAAACLALAINLWFTPVQSPQPERAANPSPAVTPEKLTPAQEFAAMMQAPGGMVKATWASGTVTEIRAVSGDVVWSDAKQVGYMRLKGLPVNDKNKETYQLWIYDKGQDKKTPIDGGIFDINADGEAIIPITAKLKAAGPEMFAITVEKPGGVVVSDKKKIAAIAKVETQPRSST
jgi:hypothetical protein